MTTCARCGRAAPEPRGFQRRPYCNEECRFWDFVETETSLEGCWLWTGSVFKRTGHGQFATSRNSPLRGRTKAKVQQAHRISWRLTKKQDLDEIILIRHMCDVPRCVNPDHLEPGDHRSNMLDFTRRGKFSKLSDLLSEDQEPVVVVETCDLAEAPF